MKKEKAAKVNYECSINFTLNKNLNRVFKEKKFLRIITLNNMVEGKSNIFIIRDTEDIESDIENLQLECLPAGKSQENNTLLSERIRLLEKENKELKLKLTKIQKVLVDK